MYADLHIHSTFSDGALSPEAIVREAEAHGVGLIAVTDHELAAGSLAAEPLARRAGIAFLRGAETECIAFGRFHHLLAYGVDFDEPALAALLADNRAKLDEMSVELVRRMAGNDPACHWRTFTPTSVTPPSAAGRGWNTFSAGASPGVSATEFRCTGSTASPTRTRASRRWKRPSPPSTQPAAARCWPILGHRAPPGRGALFRGRSGAD